jgi:hypothetical protein
MLQEVDGKRVYVVEFDEVPKLPIAWEKEEDKLYAIALARAIYNKTITEPGKYGINVEIQDGEILWNAFKIIED